MLLVIDANVVFAALIARGGTFRVFVMNKILRKFRFIAPEYLFIEIREHFDEILKKTKLSQEELEVVLDFLEEQIEVVPFEEFEDEYDVARRISPDPDDVPYFALALKLNCAIWSNDRKLEEQDIVKVYTTRDIIQMLRMEEK
ncbi:PIN domain-containing protein [Geoglobus acetivorans]|uniref:PIN domain-containing protein n=1 Tax=Geoglobus acetivorans TaxID=565033 RepID=UPI00064FDBE2